MPRARARFIFAESEANGLSGSKRTAVSDVFNSTRYLSINPRMKSSRKAAAIIAAALAELVLISRASRFASSLEARAFTNFLRALPNHLSKRLVDFHAVERLAT
jgi:hypothetical protein